MDLIAVALLNLGSALNRSEGETAAVQEGVPGQWPGKPA